MYISRCKFLYIQTHVNEFMYSFIIDDKKSYSYIDMYIYNIYIYIYICIYIFIFMYILIVTLLSLLPSANAKDYPMSDMFKIMCEMMLKLKKNKIDLRLEFKNIDKHNSGNLSELIFVKILDNLRLTSNLNDQELITILRRFQSEKNYIYNEICDLFSHIFITSKNSSSSCMNNYDVQFLLNNLRTKTTQWRRAFRFFMKKSKSENGGISLGNLIDIFQVVLPYIYIYIYVCVCI
jgi:hypothetical protein